jgi:hypothetical protein
MVTGKMGSGLFEAAAVKSPFLKNLVASLTLCDGYARKRTNGTNLSFQK